MPETGRMNWEDLCRSVAETEDPDELLNLVEKLNDLFDQEERARRDTSKAGMCTQGGAPC